MQEEKIEPDMCHVPSKWCDGFFLGVWMGFLRERWLWYSPICQPHPCGFFLGGVESPPAVIFNCRVPKGGCSRGG